MSATIVPILGMHRSGTSALAGALHNGGISMGPERHFRPKPLPENPKGFYEDYRFRRLNDLICRRNGYQIKSWDLPPKMLNDAVSLLVRRALLVLANGRRFPSWGWKDPRTCLTFDFWTSTLRLLGRLDDVHVLFVFRDPLAVADSLERRDGLPLERALDLWHEYNARAFRSLEASGVPASFVAFSDLLRDPARILGGLAEHLPGLDPVAGVEFVDPRYRRSSGDSVAGLPDGEGEMVHPALELFEALEARSS